MPEQRTKAVTSPRTPKELRTSVGGFCPALR